MKNKIKKIVNKAKEFEKIVDSGEANPKGKWFEWVRKFVKWNSILSIGSIIGIISLSIVSHNQKQDRREYEKKMTFKVLEMESQIFDLEKLNISLMMQGTTKTVAIDMLPFPWWDKIYDEEHATLKMFSYNEATYKLILEPLGHPRYFYAGKTDKQIFGEPGIGFFNEDMKLIEELKRTGKSIVYKEYTRTWITPSGKKQKGGYWRWARKIDGIIHTFGVGKTFVDF